MPGLMDGKRGLVMGVANDHSIAWGIAKMLHDHGAKLAFTYQGDALAKRVKPLAQSVGSSFLMPCDVEDIASVDAVFDEIKKQWGTLDFLVHAVAFSDKSELKGRYADTTRENFIRTMVISCYAFTEAAKRAAALMPNGGSMVTLTYNGGERAMPNYNVMAWPRPGWKLPCAIWRWTSGRRRSASTPSRPGRSARWLAPASPRRATCLRSSRNILRSAAV